MTSAKAKPGVQPKTPIFDALIEEARRTPPGEWLTGEELERDFQLSEEYAAGRARLDRWRGEDEDDGGKDQAGVEANGAASERRASRKRNGTAASGRQNRGAGVAPAALGQGV